MKNSLVSVLALGAIAVLPLASMAATYHYVDTSGTVRTVEAANASIATAMATNIALHSGVALDMGVLNSGDSVNGTGTNTVTVTTSSGSGYSYHYVDTSGIVRTVVAASPAAALAAAVNIALHSGVVTDTGALEAGVSVTAQ